MESSPGVQAKEVQQPKIEEKTDELFLIYWENIKEKRVKEKKFLKKGKMNLGDG